MLIVGATWVVSPELVAVGIMGGLLITAELWQVHATIAGFSFVALVFYWETLTAKVTVAEAIGHLTDATEVLGTVYTLLLANAFIGFAALYTSSWLPPQPASTLPPIGIFEVLVASSCLGVFLLSLIDLIGFWEGIYRTLFRTGIEESVCQSLSVEMNEKQEEEPEPSYSTFLERIPSVQYPHLYFSHDWQAERLTADDLSIAGHTVTDVHLGRLQSALNHLEPSDEGIEIQLRPGKELQRNTRLVQLDNKYSDEQLFKFKSKFSNAIKTRK